MLNSRQKFDFGALATVRKATPEPLFDGRLSGLMAVFGDEFAGEIFQPAKSEFC
jgi:hypothetical protein